MSPLRYNNNIIFHSFEIFYLQSQMLINVIPRQALLINLLYQIKSFLFSVLLSMHARSIKLSLESQQITQKCTKNNHKGTQILFCRCDIIRLYFKQILIVLLKYCSLSTYIIRQKKNTNSLVIPQNTQNPKQKKYINNRNKIFIFPILIM